MEKPSAKKSLGRCLSLAAGWQGKVTAFATSSGHDPIGNEGGVWKGRLV